MRPLAVAVLALAWVIQAPAAGVDPSVLVLRGADLPKGFELVPEQSGLRTSALEGRASAKGRAFIRRWKRVTGYQAAYKRGAAAEIEARVDVFREAAGAEAMLAWVDREWRRQGGARQQRATLDIGTRGVVYSSLRDAQTLVLWRHGRVFSGINFFALPREQSIALARRQERRIAEALG